MTDMKRVESSEKIDLSEWSFGFGDLDKAIAPGVQETIDLTLQNVPPSLFLPVIFEPVDDPLTILLSLPFDSRAIGECHWALPLEALILDQFELVDPDAMRSVGLFAERLRLLADRLREIADKVAPPEPNQ